LDGDTRMKFESVEDLLEHYGVYIDRKKSNKRDFMVRCVFHDDTNPSMSVSRLKGLYNCFSCGAKGNIYHLIKQLEGCSYQQAMKIWDGEQAIEFGKKYIPEEVIDWYGKYMTLKSIIRLLLYPSNWMEDDYRAYEKYEELVTRQKYFEDGTLLNPELQMKRVLLDACDQQLWDEWALDKSDNFNWYERFIDISRGTRLQTEVGIAVSMIINGFVDDTLTLQEYYADQLRSQREVKSAPEGMTLEECILQNWT